MPNVDRRQVASLVLLGVRVEYRDDGQWHGVRGTGKLVTGFHKLYVAMPHDYSPTPLASFVEWLTQYLPVTEVEFASTIEGSSTDAQFKYGNRHDKGVY